MEEEKVEVNNQANKVNMKNFDFKSLDYKKYLKHARQDALLLFITDDLGGSEFADEKMLKSFMDKCEVRLVYAGKVFPTPSLLEKLPADIEFDRLSDLLGTDRPVMSRIIAAADLSRKTLESEFDRLKMYLTAKDILLVQDASAFFESKPDVSYEDGTLQECLQKILSGELATDKTTRFYFRSRKPESGTIQDQGKK